MSMRIPKQQKPVEQGQHKYHCRICNKTFSTGRALGGHMRIHGMHNEPARLPDEASSNTGAEGDSSDGDRLLARHICEDCREEFGSWKSWSKHCCIGDGGADGNGDDSKGLSRPPPPLLTEEEHLANCLVLLSNARNATDGPECSTAASVPILITEAGECSTSERNDEIVDSLVVVPPSLPQSEAPPQVSAQTPPIARAVYECNSCQKVFNSHQALGGHRASHKKVRGCFANRLESQPAKISKYTTMEGESNNQARASSENMTLAIVPFVEAASSQLQLPKQKSKVHECSICKRQFPSGQALGGHKRCHWSASSSRGATATTALVAVKPLSVVATELQVGNSNTEPLAFNSIVFSLDLNLPAPTDDFPEFTLWVDMPAATSVEPERENTRENVNIEEADSREVRVTDLSELIDMNEREGGSKWLHIGFESISDQENGAD